MTPEPLKMPELRAGHVGYVITGSRDVKSAIVGDTLYKPSDESPAMNKARSISHWFPYDPVGVVNAVP